MVSERARHAYLTLIISVCVNDISSLIDNVRSFKVEHANIVYCLLGQNGFETADKKLFKRRV